MRLLFKDQYKKIKGNLFNFISLSLLVIIISLSFTAVKSSIKRLEDNYDSYLSEQNIEDFYFSMGLVDINYLGGTAIIQLCEELEIIPECTYALSYPEDSIATNNLNFLINERIDERPDLYENIIDGYVQKFVDKYDFEVEKKKVVNIYEDEFIYKFTSITENISIPYIVKGELPLENYQIAIYPEFAEENNIEVGDNYTINGTDFLVTGFIYLPEFTFPIFNMNTISFDKSLQTIVLCNDDTINNLGQHIFTKYIVDGDIYLIMDEFDYTSVQTLDLSILGKSMQMVNILVPTDINFRVTSLRTEVNNANAFTNIFLSLFIVFISILLITFMKKHIEKNKDDIYSLHALGYTFKELSFSLLLYPLLISLMSIIGYILGLIVSNNLFEIYSSRYLFPKSDFVLYFDIFIYSVIVPIILILVINYIFIYKSISFNKFKKQKKQWRIFRFTPIKTVVITSLLFITINIMIIFGLSGNSMFSAFVEETKVGNNYEEMINLQYLTNEEFDDDYDSFTRTTGYIISVNEDTYDSQFKTSIYGINSNNELKLLIDNDITNNLLLEEGVIISDYLSMAADLKVNDTITFLIGSQEVTMEIMGISNELIENSMFMSKEELNSYYDIDNSYYNGIYAIDDLFESDYIVSRINYNTSLDEMSSLLNISSLIMSYLVILSTVLALFIFSMVIISYLNDNRINIAILKSIGLNNKEINLKYLIIIYFVLLLTFLLSIPITKILLDTLMYMLVSNIGFKLILDIKPLNIIIGFAILNIIFFTTIILTNKYYEKISISEIMKKNIK